MKADALEVQQNLKQECGRRTTAQSELDTLYASIFQGPTPSFPEEDDAERNVESALQTYNTTCAKLEADRQVEHILGAASKRIGSSLNYIEEALDASRLDMFGGGSGADLMERSALHKAEMNVVQAQMMVAQAQRISPEVQDLPAVHIDQGNLFGDILFDNIFSDMEFHDKIKDSRAEVQRCAQVLGVQLTAAKERCHASEQLSEVQSNSLKNAREELQKVRQVLFKHLADGGASTILSDGPERSEAPPPYS